MALLLLLFLFIIILVGFFMILVSCFLFYCSCAYLYCLVLLLLAVSNNRAFLFFSPQADSVTTVALSRFGNDEKLAVLYIILKEIGHELVQEVPPESNQRNSPNYLFMAEMISDAYSLRGKIQWKPTVRQKLDMLLGKSRSSALSPQVR